MKCNSCIERARRRDAERRAWAARMDLQETRRKLAELMVPLARGATREAALRLQEHRVNGRLGISPRDRRTLARLACMVIGEEVEKITGVRLALKVPRL